ncbi:MAG TPA: class I SAM-dependent methyltransferase [Blastocatellia bacterium]|nr:class I SAM-dependent methyltransferase [Blastocatellia bacterium]
MGEFRGATSGIDIDGRVSMAAAKATCYLCDSPSPRPFLKVKAHRLLICDHCGLVYERDRHDGGGISADQKRFLNEYLLEEALYAQYFDQKLQWIESFCPPGTLLDFGCGAGTFLLCARKRGWKVVGVEGSASAAALARSRGLEIREGIIENLSLSGAFDVVTAFQTIEHFADPVAFLKSVKSLLRPGGAAVLTTPDRKSLMGRIQGKRWFGYYNDEHLFFYDRPSFEATLKKSLLTDIEVTREAGRLLSPSWVVTRLFQYYYTSPAFLRRLILCSPRPWKWCDWLHLREPSVNLVALARNNGRVPHS